MDNEKDMIAIKEVDTVIERLQSMRKVAEQRIGRSRPIFSESDIAIVKDHLDLVVKYSRL